MVETAQATGSKITEEALDKLRKMIGREYPLDDQYNTVATEDAIRHYALGIGDDNPRWLDPSYAKTTRWKGITAHPTFVMTCGFARSHGLPGVHALFSGIDLQCHAPIRAGTRISATASLHDLVEKQGQYAGRQFQQIYETKYRDESDTLLATLHSYSFRTERQTASSKGKYTRIERQAWTDDELAKVEEDIERERDLRAGGTPRFWDDVSVGDTVGPIVKGPLTVTDCICFLMGFGYIFVRAHRQWHEFRKLYPKAGIKNSHGIWDIPERVHWEEEMPTKIGMPGPYDYGNQRVAWFDHGIHDWMGDDGWLRRLKVRISAPNFIGDVTWLKGRVSALSEADSSVVVDMEAVDQRGRTTATAICEVVLPRR
ncbi:MaoC family dehydratase N-terminal domain-containing protein [Bradyrhizobium sp. LHD-71]|uniref:FAS1-like dehydratase domain-containing protein n=1 Tax=Bradyrhizobium sp. LHD-71 TaxID=3072141 RepID=UPI0028102D71|nr:MaoC family dehydratase N-terminal domain-containing protein [Bradyrhizobium sp. LHD-71]MDQ8726597.1 MaoC family dehydratase N-terminal domain-containing protein [Bradyrhizobium sp. LHD-71]